MILKINKFKYADIVKVLTVVFSLSESDGVASPGCIETAKNKLKLELLSN